MLDLILRRGTLPDGRTDIDLGIEAGRIVAVQPHARSTAPGSC